MVSEYYHREIKCPYYTGNRPYELGCEISEIEFRDKRSINYHIDHYCGSWNWEQCSLARTYTNYYERGGNHEYKGKNRHVREEERGVNGEAKQAGGEPEEHVHPSQQ